MRLIADRKERLDKFLSRVLPDFSRSQLARAAQEGKVLVQGSPRRASFEVTAGAEIELELPAAREAHDLTPANIPLDVVYEDDSMLVVNKPRGLAVHPAASLREPSLVNALLARGHELSTSSGVFRPGIVHRLDKDTTGLLVVAKNDLAHRRLAKQIEQKHAARRYFAVVAGEVENARFIVSAPIARNKKNRLLMAIDPAGRTAVSHFKRIRILPEGTLLAVSLETGRTHQIRVHLQSAGHPVLGDRLYAPKRFQDVPLQLHAAFLALEHPVTGEKLTCYADPPPDFVGRDEAKQQAIDPF